MEPWIWTLIGLVAVIGGTAATILTWDVGTYGEWSILGLVFVVAGGITVMINCAWHREGAPITEAQLVADQEYKVVKEPYVVVVEDTLGRKTYVQPGQKLPTKFKTEEEWWNWSEGNWRGAKINIVPLE